MGGHGGLNILPQKKWNVYNYENRKIVERDKRIAKEKEDQENYQKHRHQARDRIQRLKKNKFQGSHTPSPQSSRSQSKQKETINQEFKKIQESKQNVNFFKEEEEQINRQENLKARIQLEKEFFKDKPYDITTKFLGSFDQDKPWYNNNQNQDQTLQNNVREQMKQFKDQNQTYYQVLDLDGKLEQKQIKKENIDDSQEIKRKQEKKERKRQKKLQKLAKQLKEMIGSDSESEERLKKQDERKLKDLRRERLQREKVEKERERKLLLQIKQ